jgi:hypothetical protein
VPAGVELLDARAGTRRTIDRRGGGVARAGRTLLVSGGRYSSAGRGVRGYRLDGRRRFSLLRRQRVQNVEVYSSRFAYAIGPRDVWVIDVRRGRVVHHARRTRSRDVELLPRR